MRCLTPIRLTTGLAALMLAQSGWAAGTTAGTVVENTATLDYSINNTPQTQIVSDVSDFKVDRKVDLTVTGNQGTNYLVAPLSPAIDPVSSPDNNPANEISYTLKNEGNSVQDFEISMTQHTTDDYDASDCQVTIEVKLDPSGTNTAGTVMAGPVLISTKPVVTLPEDAEFDILVACTMPDLDTVDDDDEATLEVVATAVSAPNTPMAETTGADSEDDIDTVLADGTGGAEDGADRNAMHSDTQTYEIDAPELSVVKTSAVISDPFNGTTDPKRIPGAVIEYTITISNSSDAEATGVTVTDTIDTDGTSGSGPNTVTFVGGSIVISDGSGTATGSFADPVVTATGLTIPAASGTDGVATVTFRVTIN